MVNIRCQGAQITFREKPPDTHLGGIVKSSLASRHVCERILIGIDEVEHLECRQRHFLGRGLELCVQGEVG